MCWMWKLVPGVSANDPRTKVRSGAFISILTQKQHDHSKQAESAHFSKLQAIMEAVVATAPQSRASVICANEHEPTGHW